MCTLEQSKAQIHGKISFRLTFSLRTPVEVVRYDLRTKGKRQGVRYGKSQ